jgi:hypothetical protein
VGPRDGLDTEARGKSLLSGLNLYSLHTSRNRSALTFKTLVGRALFTVSSVCVLDEESYNNNPWRHSSDEPWPAEQPPLAVFPDCTRRYWTPFQTQLPQKNPKECPGIEARTSVFVVFNANH